MPKNKRPIEITLPFQTACVLRSLIRGAVGGDFTENEARIALDKLDNDPNARGIPALEYDCFFVAHVEMSPRETAVKRPRKRRDT